MQLAKYRNQATFVAILCIILAAFAVRVHSLGDDACFTSDELTTVTNSMHSLSEIWELAHGTPLQELWVRLGAMGLGLGYNEFGVYYMSVIPGVLAVAVIYRLGKALFSRQVGLLCAFLLALSAYHIYWSRSARYYASMTLLSSVAFLCLYLALTTNSRRAWAGYALFRILSLYDHLSVLPVWVAEGVLVLLVLSFPLLRDLWRRRALGRNALSQVWRQGKARLRSGHARRSLFASRFFRVAVAMTIILLAFAPRGYLVLLNAYLGTSGLYLPGLSSDQGASIGSVVSSQLYVSWQSPLIVLRLFDSWASPLHAVMMVGFVGGCLFCVLRRQWLQVLLVLTLMITPFVLFAMIGYKKPINGRYLISLLPLYYVMVGQGFSGLSQAIIRAVHLPERHRATASWGFLAIFMVAYAGLAAPRIALTRWNVGQNWRGVARFLEHAAQPGQLIVVEGKPVKAMAMQHYLRGLNVVERDPQVDYETYYQDENGFWLVSEVGMTYGEIRADLPGLHYVSLLFRGGWDPDLDQASALRPALSWDLDVAYVSRNVTSAEDAFALYEDWMPQAEAQHVRRHLTYARAYTRFGQPESAVPEYTMALTEGYVNEQLASRIYDARGMCWYSLRHKDNAIADWRLAITRDDWNDRPYRHLGEAYMQSGDNSAAKELYEAAIAANPGKAWPHVLLGDYYRLTDLEDQAALEFCKAIEIDPSDQEAYKRLERMYASEGRETQVISLYHGAMQSNPSAAWPHLYLGQFYQRVGQAAEAVMEYQLAVELQPEYGSEVSKLLSDSFWDLAAVLSSVARAYSDQGDLLWWPDHTWVRPYPHEQKVLVSRSALEVEGSVRPNQLLIHPFGDQARTYLQFEMLDNVFTVLRVGYGLADDVAGLTNGVDYSVEVRGQGADEYEPLFAQTVTENVWRERTISLAPYWSEDLDFRLVVDARGDDTYDWLQTTIELLPPPLAVWNLSAHLAEAELLPDSLLLEWRDDGFFSADGSRLVGTSQLPVGGQSLPSQAHLHPYSSEIDTTLVLTVPNNVYSTLKTSWALADEAVSHSNGVDYAVSVSTDGGQTFMELLRSRVTSNAWSSQLVTLPPSESLVLRLSSSALQDATYDWLQVSLVLLPSDGGYEESYPVVEPEAPG